MKKTLLITLEFPPQVGGVANLLANLCARLPNDKISVLAPRVPRNYLFDQNQKYKIYRRKLIIETVLFWPRWFFLFWHTCRLIRQEIIEERKGGKRTEEILVGQVLPVGYSALILWKLFKIPYSVLTYGMDITLPARNKWKRRMLIMVLRNARRIICAGSFVQSKVVELGMPKEKTIVIYPCPNLNQESRTKNQSFDQTQGRELRKEIIKKHNLEGKRILLTVGRLVERKGHDMVIEAMPKVLDKVPNAVYLIVGDGPNLNNLKFKILNFKLEGKVIFAGKVPDEGLSAYFDLGDVFIMPSREIDGDVEGFGIVYLEANTAGKPVIGGRSGGVSEAVKEGVSGLLVDPLNVNEIAEAIIKLLTNEELRIKLGNQGKERVEKEFRWEREAEKIVKLLNG
jgi:phosphatidylinositol alpha-1,6-mannosyltransferase